MREEVFLKVLDEEISSHINKTFDDVMKGYEYKMKKNKTKKLAFVTAAGIALVCAIGFGAYYYTPQSYISIDINPSIELETNFADKVIGTNGANEDAVAVLSAVDINNKPIDEAIKTIVEETIDQGYINSEKDNAILITVANDDEEKSSTIDEKIKTTVDEVLQETNQEAEVVDVLAKKDQVQVKETAKQLGISVGKANVIDNIIRKANKNGETNLTTEQLMNLSVKELIQLFKNDKDKVEDLLDDIQDALDDVDDEDIVNDKGQNKDDKINKSQNSKVDTTKNKDNDITDNGKGNSKTQKVDNDDDDDDDDDKGNTAKQPQNGKVDETKNKDNVITDNDNGKGNSKTQKVDKDDDDDEVDIDDEDDDDDVSTENKETEQVQVKNESSETKLTNTNKNSNSNGSSNSSSSSGSSGSSSSSSSSGSSSSSSSSKGKK